MSRVQASENGNRLSNLTFTSTGRKLTLNGWVKSGANLSLAHDQVNQLSLTLFDDTVMSLYNNGNINKGTTVTYGALRFEVRGYGVTPDDGSISLTLRSKSNAKLKDQTGAKNWGKQGVTTFMQRRFKEAGLKAIVQPGLGTRTFTRAKAEAGQPGESTWDVMTKLREDMGLWVFEAGGYGICARPDWIAKTWPSGINKWQFWWNSVTDYHKALAGSPTHEYTADSEPNSTLSFKVLGDWAEQIKPGDLVRITGKYRVVSSGLWIVSSVTIPLVATEAVQVTCERPVAQKITKKKATKKKAKKRKKKKVRKKLTKKQLLAARRRKLAAKRKAAARKRRR